MIVERSKKEGQERKISKQKFLGGRKEVGAMSHAGMKVQEKWKYCIHRVHTLSLKYEGTFIVSYPTLRKHNENPKLKFEYLTLTQVKGDEKVRLAHGGFTIDNQSNQISTTVDDPDLRGQVVRVSYILLRSTKWTTQVNNKQ